jgi:hypothetical protein
MKSPNQLPDSGKLTMAELLLRDAEMALVFIQLAGSTSDSVLKKRRLKGAARAYGRIIAFMPRVSLTPEQMALLQQRLSALQAHLKGALSIV